MVDKDYWKRYQKKNKEQLRAYQQNYRFENHERVLRKQREWHEKNPEYRKEYYEKNKHRFDKYKITASSKNRKRNEALHRTKMQREKNFMTLVDESLIDLEKFSKIDEDNESYSYTISMRKYEFDLAMKYAREYEPQIKNSEFIRSLIKMFIMLEAQKRMG